MYRDVPTGEPMLTALTRDLDLPSASFETPGSLGVSSDANATSAPDGGEPFYVQGSTIRSLPTWLPE